MVQVQAKDENGALFIIRLDRSGSDGGLITIGAQGGAANAHQFKLYNIRRVTSSEIRCKAEVPVLFDPTVSCQLFQSTISGVYIINLVAQGYYSGRFSILTSDYNAILHFLNTPPFPGV